jgi:hypothetical protein
MKNLLGGLLIAVAVLGSGYTWAEYFPSKLNEPIHRVACYLQFAQRGCCSYHQGVCDCNSGNVVCCDGTYSPSCRC